MSVSLALVKLYP
uniref:Uncharacterized protein n=1 Tax=Anguilla anguilla TaxID=7936 RepID=A0A0E9V9Z1_ANGAN